MLLVVGLLGPAPVSGSPGAPVQEHRARPGSEVSSPDLVVPQPSVPKPTAVVPAAWDPRMPRVEPRSRDDLAEFGPEVVERRDAVSDVFANADGTDTVVMHGEPVHFQRDGSSLWENIDNSIVADPERPGWVRNAANDWTVHFGPVGPGGTGGIEMETDAGVARWAPDLPVGAAAVAPVVAGSGDESTVTYPAVWPGVDVVYSVSNTRVCGS
jgi:hypothetical protein